MGDPAVECWTGFPDPLAIDYPATIPVGANAVPVTVTEGGQPSVGAQVCLWKGSKRCRWSASPNALGQVELDVSPATAGNLILTVTKHNRYPQLLTVPVANQTVRRLPGVDDRR